MPRTGQTGRRTSDVEEESELPDAGLDTPSGVCMEASTGASIAREFKSLMLKDDVLRGLELAGYERPSPVQARAIPLGKLGADLVIQAKSGTGKTCVFAVVVLESISLDFRAPHLSRKKNDTGHWAYLTS